ncbi:MAG: skgA-A [Arthrobacter sp.]|jgi:DNA-binding transcriptional MerR regulator|nr:skgA-A [Arthrobacter sp.]
MAYTVKQVAAMSGVSVRTLHFYDETALLKPARHGASGYRFYEEPQLLRLQQILFYRELGFELKQIKEVLDREEFEKIAALESHRKVLLQNLKRTQKLIQTIDNTIQHLKGGAKMQAQELFAGFSVAEGEDRFGEHIRLGERGEPVHCKVSARDTNGALCIFEFTGAGGGPPHLHHEQDEWIYVLEGLCYFKIGTERLRLAAGESIFIPRKTAHCWGCKPGAQAKIINVYQPAGSMEEFFRAVGNSRNLPTEEDVINSIYTEVQVQEVFRLFEAHGMCVTGPPPMDLIE